MKTLNIVLKEDDGAYSRQVLNAQKMWNSLMLNVMKEVLRHEGNGAVITRVNDEVIIDYRSSEK